MQDRADLTSGSHGPLTGLAVVELGHGIAASYTGRVLADLGARVTKIEWPGQDPTRHAGPFPPGRDGDPDYSGLFRYLNEGKEIDSRIGQPASELTVAVRAAAAGADVLIIDDHADWTAAGLAPDDLAAANPRLVVASVTPFGLDGPYAGFRAYDST